MFSHIMIGSNDLARSRALYDALLGALGGKPGQEGFKDRLVYVHGGGMLLIGHPLDGRPATGANGGTIGFSASSAEQVEAWHRAGVANGATAIEDPPGIRQGSIGPLYLAYLRDPDGNKLCAVFRMPAGS